MERDEAFRGLLAAGGRMGPLISGFDWSSSPLGPVRDWPQSLRSSLSICLSSRFPMFVFWGPELVQLYNDSFVPVLGAKHPQALGRAASSTWAETWDVVGPMLGQVLASGEAAYFENLMVILERSGFAEECYFTFCYSPVHDESGKVAGVFGTVSETTSQVVEARRLAVLAELSERTRTLGSVAEVCQVAGEVFAGHGVEVPFSLLYLLDRDDGLATLAGCSGLEPGTVLSPPVAALSGDGQGGAFSWPLADACAGSVEITGLHGELLAAMKLEGFAPPSSAILMPVAMAGERGPGGLMIVGLGSGQPLDASYRTFVRLAAGHLSAAFADATALEAARDRAAQLAALDRAKTAFFSNVSHELRTPLTLMLTPLEDLLAGQGRLQPADRERAELAYRNALRLLRHVNTLLDFSRPAEAGAEPRPEPLDLAGITAELAGLFKVVLDRGGLRLVINCPPLPQPVWADPGMWEQVVLNLLANAFKFTFQGEITVSVDAAGGQARIRVSDTGVGIPANELPRLFDRFYQAAGTQGRSGEGSGIGLSLVRELVQRHGGTISVASIIGSGTTFTVLLPFGQAPPGAQALDTQVLDAPHSPGPRAGEYVQEVLSWTPDPSDPVTSEPPEVLIVDDNADMRSYLTSALAPHWRVRAASDGAAALQAIRQQQPELVLTDVMMPRLDGFGLLGELRSATATRDIPVIMVSARAGPEALVSGLDVGADDYLVKPFTTAELTARIRTHLRIFRQRRQTAARLQTLADATREFNASLDQQQISNALTRYLVPGHAASCIVQLHDAADAGTHNADRAQLSVTLASRGHVVGTMTLTGLTAAALDSGEQAFVTELASRAAAALDNASRYQHDHSTALHLQSAMLTEVPASPGLDSAALYRPAVTRDLVGGDWYDSFPIPAAPGTPDPGTSLAIAIGDVTGHDLHAATLMGQVRSMLRQAALDHQDLGPHAAVTALEQACATLAIGATGTLILGRLDRAADTWTLTWTNAGHPGPLLCHPDGTVRSLDQHDFMFYPGLYNPPVPRSQHQLELSPGSTILLYTDGLVDRPGGDYGHDVEHAAQILATHRGFPLSQLLSTLVAEIAGQNHTDDIALLAVRIE
jgi:signal transduction histidine kinase/CheY-like chemotaxis protein/serine phosphatase RsbU (regulator of sigma subunit)